jgi:hypothetical protein
MISFHQTIQPDQAELFMALLLMSLGLSYKTSFTMQELNPHVTNQCNYVS